METTMKPTRTILALFVAVLALPMAAIGQAAEASANATSNDEVIDDIVVVGQKSLNDLRRDVFKAEEDFYSVFNNYNDEKDYDVRCFNENANPCSHSLRKLRNAPRARAETGVPRRAFHSQRQMR